jgi:hypothetical protein
VLAGGRVEDEIVTRRVSERIDDVAARILDQPAEVALVVVDELLVVVVVAHVRVSPV